MQGTGEHFGRKITRIAEFEHKNGRIIRICEPVDVVKEPNCEGF